MVIDVQVPIVEIVVPVESIVVVVKEEEKKEEVSEDERLKKMYLEELEAAKLGDNLLKENLRQMMNMGYYNYRVNYNLLLRNKNDLVVAVNKLCNNIVTDSMFEAKK